ncbi:AraC family transcriptional regulator [Reinekea sp.]|jgi:AraC-like DNA-binding protein|uniref:helix-turn-helix transcriptional regulator n=1 Tax=Reinekea sp. TaxID=1970455 RepID=UPI002A7F9FAB|nr:AraC family transcriptional regulator [Reinekea sp.]
MAVDRLSALFHHFHLQAIHPDSGHGLSANLLLCATLPPASPGLELQFSPLGHLPPSLGLLASDITRIHIDFGGIHNPLFAGMPALIRMPIDADHPAWWLANMISNETQTQRCGGPAALDRLYEVLTIYLLRFAIEQGLCATGPMAGLADDQLKLALVAIHDNPSGPWNTEQLAETAGLSRTAFIKRFSQTVGMSPMLYVRQWRLTLAQQGLKRGERVGKVALSFGYNSQEGFSRAFKAQFGYWPSEQASRVPIGSI